jgi:hypothetical protein
MPMHPKYPPFKTKIVDSESKDSHKHVITVPKPVIQSNWKKWAVKKEEQSLVWFPQDIENIINLLEEDWIVAYSKALSCRDSKKTPLVYVIYNTSKPLEKPESWYLMLKPFLKGNKLDFEEDLNPHKPEKMFHVVSDQELEEYDRIKTTDPNFEIEEYVKLENMKPELTSKIKESMKEAVWHIVTIAQPKID